MLLIIISFLYYLYSYLLFIFCTGTNSSILQSKIICGIESKIGSRPYLASLRKNNEHICGGCLISTSHVLTAASCVVLFKDDKPYEKYSVVLGTVNLENGGVHRKILDIHVHYDYKILQFQQSHSDIALVTVRIILSFHARRELNPH